MRHITTLLQIVGCLSIIASSLLLGSLHSQLVRHTPAPVNTITGSLG